MQPLAGPPRDAYTPDQVRAVLTADQLVADYGCDLLDGNNQFLEDLSADLATGKVARNNYADVHGTCSLTVQRELAWGQVRARPWMLLSSPLVPAVEPRFNLGVFTLTTPEGQRGQTPQSWDVDGYDLLHLLSTDGPGDCYVVGGGTTYLDAIRTAVDASGVGAPLLLAGDRQNTAIPADRVWAPAEGVRVTWLRILNDLLAAIGYRGLWADQDGTLRSGPYQAPATRASEWLFDTADQRTNLVGEDRKITADVWGAPNWWRFVRKGMSTRPVEGNGLYTVQNVDGGPTSQNALGRVVHKPLQYLDAADQDSLVSQGDATVDADTAATRTYTLKVSALPIAGHFDVVTFIDANRTDKCQVANWELPLDGSLGTWELEAVTGA
jgi:hypothetical protein